MIIIKKTIKKVKLFHFCWLERDGERIIIVFVERNKGGVGGEILGEVDVREGGGEEEGEEEREKEKFGGHFGWWWGGGGM